MTDKVDESSQGGREAFSGDGTASGKLGYVEIERILAVARGVRGTMEAGDGKSFGVLHRAITRWV